VKKRVIRKKRIIFNVLAFFFVSEILGGPLRYYLPQTGYPEVLYIFKALLLAGIFYYVVITILNTRKINVFLIFFGAIMLFWGLYGYYNIGNIKQVAFGFWILIPMVAGVILRKEMITNWSNWLSFISFLWFISVLGVIVNNFIKYPWEGAIFSIGDTELRSAKLWFGLGTKRLAGFGRASSITSDQIIVLSILLIGKLTKRKWIVCCIWILSFIAIVLTTNKTAIVIMALVGFLWFFWNYSPKFGSFLLKISIIGVGFLSIVFPISAFIIYQSPQILKYQSLFNSIITRFSWTWPRIYNMMTEYGNLLMGRGIGGIGTAQKLFSPNLPGISDNLSVYLFATFGLVGYIVYINFIFSSLLSVVRDRFSYTLGVLAFVIMSLGITSNVIESPIAAFVFGVLLGTTFFFITKNIERPGR